MLICGHCHNDHDTVAEVRECSTRDTSNVESPAPKPVDVDDSTIQSLKRADEEGFYKHNGNAYKVVESQNGRLYAKLLIVTDDNDYEWEYAPGAMFSLLRSHKMTAEQAAEYGQLTGRCMVCGRKLTNEQSIEAGIGPICAERF